MIYVTATKDDQPDIFSFSSTTTISKQQWTVTPSALGSSMSCVPSGNKHNKSDLETTCYPVFIFFFPRTPTGILTWKKNKKTTKNVSELWLARFLSLSLSSEALCSNVTWSSTFVVHPQGHLTWVQNILVVPCSPNDNLRKYAMILAFSAFRE